MSAPLPLSKKQLYVGNLPLTFMSGDLEREFLVFGPLSDFFVSIWAGRHRGFGFVTFQSSASASAAEKAMNGKVMENRPMKVMFARERSEGDSPHDINLLPADSASCEASKKSKRKKRNKEKQQRIGNETKKSIPAASALSAPAGKVRGKKQVTLGMARKKKRTKSAPTKDEQSHKSPVLPRGHQSESPYILLSGIFDRQRLFLTENEDAKPLPSQIKAFIRKTDIQIRNVLKECTETFGKPPPPHIIQNLQDSFKTISWNWNISTGGDRFDGTQPPTVAQLVAWCNISISFLEKEVAKRKN
jgi:RNA recognition motif-containing protein